ncbi:metallophosphoesterase [Hydrogenophaga sp. PAMC20947]|uniref:metallophosphoesterase n=1 Tax=Hydrogenophaga sp. PAMC20947 TaxID=2565558 RepID=UPI00109DE5BB|nr:metallophosphoesterase [Hydrogenophaga sp. PAMC20947]QCB48427.1 hypothetical protein E5678_21780 [Hydrogenophaga sp. PAMC20947]
MVVALIVTLVDYLGRWSTPGFWVRNLVMHALYWSPRIAGAFLLTGLLSHSVVNQGFRRWRAAVLSVAVLIGLWSSLVEPGMVRVRETTFSGIPASTEPVRLVVISDIHWGLFFRDDQLVDLVDRLNALEVDAVMVAGDWTHEPPPDLTAGLAPLAKIRHPVFAVLGNHDVESPGPPLTGPLKAALQTHGVQLLEGRVVPWKGWELVGLDDQWGGHPQLQVKKLWPQPTSMGTSPPSVRLVLAHQPDTIALLPKGAAFLSFAGHTHGGQIWIPGLTPWVLRNTNSEQPWWNGVYQTRGGPLLVTPGIGTIGLPARLGVVPTIDVVTLQR